MAEKKFIIDRPDIMMEWDWEKNTALCLNPNEVSVGSHKKAFWICHKHNYKYAQVVREKAQNGRVKCKLCFEEKWDEARRFRYIKGKKVLAETHPHLLDEWVKCEDDKITPYNCVAGTNKKVIWKCKICGGEYETYIYNRAINGTGCRYCSGQAVLRGFNDLATTNPDLTKEWSEKNELSPFEVTQFSKEKVYWKCNLGHNDYLSSVQDRSCGRGCPVCAQQSQTSFPEQALYFYIKKLYPNALNRYIIDRKYELDIFIPEKNIAIEYNGYFSHKNKEAKDKIKKQKVTEKGIVLLVIKEYKEESDTFGADFYIHERSKANDLNVLITSVINYIGEISNLEINVERDMIKIQEQYLVMKKERSIANLRPDLLAEWDYKKNGKITPDLVTVSSGIKYYWICPICNKSYPCTPADKSRGSSCPAHRNITIVKGENDFESQHPELLKFWDYENNIAVPSQVYHNSRKPFNWICEKGHRYSSSVVDVIKSKGCPICLNKRVLPGFNDLLSQNPELAKEWDYELNSVRPDKIYYKSQNPPVYWICSKCGYKWSSRVSPRKECPNCKVQKIAINVYFLSDYSYYGTFANGRELCAHFEIDYKKQRGNISSICNRKQQGLFGKYVLRHPYDDEFSQNST